MDDNVIEGRGLLFVGDIHLSSHRPSRRREGYGDAILAKAQQIIDIANENRLIPVFTGDIYDRPKEIDEALKTRFLRILRSCWTVPHTNLGNPTHDTVGLKLADGDSLAYLRESGALIVHTDAMSTARFLLKPSEEPDGAVRKVVVGFSPYAQSGRGIPTTVEGLYPDADLVVWVTHHDIGVDGAYPGSVAPFEIAGCKLVVNGHQHLEKEHVTVGETTWCIFGTIGRTKIDQADHQPCVWSLVPSVGLTRYPLRYEADAFNMSTHLVDEASGDEIIEEARGSVFVKLLVAAESNAAPGGSDGTILREAIDSEFNRKKASPELNAVVMSLFAAAMSKAA